MEPPAPAVVRLPSVDSTQRALRELAARGAPHRQIVVAECQTAGYGRRGSPWESPAGGLWASVLLRDVPSERAGLLALAAALAVREATGRLAGETLRLKWPNDVVSASGKVAGVLVECLWTVGRCDALVGFGVDCGVERSAFSASLGMTADVLPAIDAGRLLDALLPGLFARLEETPPDELVCEARAVCVTLGRRVRVRTPRGDVEGRALGLDDAGRLLVEAPDGPVALDAGEVTLSPG